MLHVKSFYVKNEVDILKLHFIKNIKKWNIVLLIVSLFIGIVKGHFDIIPIAQHHHIDLTFSNVLHVVFNNILVYLILTIFSFFFGIGAILALKQMYNIGYYLFFTSKSYDLPIYKVYLIGGLHGVFEVYSLYLVLYFSFYCLDYWMQLLTGRTNQKMGEFYKLLLIKIIRRSQVALLLLILGGFIEIFLSSFLFEKLIER